jgi:hypothetical protein
LNRRELSAGFVLGLREKTKRVIPGAAIGRNPKSQTLAQKTSGFVLTRAPE